MSNLGRFPMFAKISSLSVIAGLAVVALPSAAFAGASIPGVDATCGVVAGADVNANCQVDITKATLTAAVGASCSVGDGGETSVGVDVGELLSACKADAGVTALLNSTLTGLLDCKAQVAADIKAELAAKID